MMTVSPVFVGISFLKSHGFVQIMEMSMSGSLEEKELIAFLSPKQSLAQVANLRLIAGQLAAVDPALLNALVWQVVIGEQACKPKIALPATLFSILPFPLSDCRQMQFVDRQAAFPPLLGSTAAHWLHSPGH
jgi:hypothetical protein